MVWWPREFGRVHVVLVCCNRILLLAAQTPTAMAVQCVVDAALVAPVATLTHSYPFILDNMRRFLLRRREIGMCIARSGFSDCITACIGSDRRMEVSYP